MIRIDRVPMKAMKTMNQKAAISTPILFVIGVIALVYAGLMLTGYSP